MVLIYTTHKNTEEAVRVGNLLLKSKLAVCVNIWPIQSMIQSPEGIKSQLEAVLLIKTSEFKIAEIEALIEQNHKYAVPFIGALEVKRFNRAYREWMGPLVSQ